MSVRAGDWVRTHRHGHHGMVVATYPDCPENEIWVKTQTGLTDEQLSGQWALVFAPSEDTVLVPVSDCEPAEEIELDDLPDRIVIEAFGPTEEEAQQITDSLDQLDGTVRRLLKIWKKGETDE